MSIIGDRRNKEAEERKAKEKELLKVSISKEDVDLIVSYFIYLFLVFLNAIITKIKSTTIFINHLFL